MALALASSCFLLVIVLTSLTVTAITNPQTVRSHSQNFNESKITNNQSIRFNISEDPDRYLDLIRNIRIVLTASSSNSIPILMAQPPSESPTTMVWLDIRLVVNDRTSITVRLDPTNLYVRGYSRNDENAFWEFSDSSLIPQSRSLRFSGSYSKGLVRTAGASRQEVLLGYSPLQNAVSILANTVSPPASPREPARALLVIIQMIAEATRINILSNFIRNNWFTPRAITPRMEVLENGWARLSTAVQITNQSTATPNSLLPNIPVENPASVWTLGEAVIVFGILLLHRDRGTRKLSSPALYYEQAVTDPVWYGTRSLMNVEYVRVNNIDGENPGDLFGTVSVDDGWYNYTVYNRSSSGSESKGPGGLATLTGTFDAAVPGEDAFVIRVSLLDYDSSSPNDEIAQGEIAWDPVVESINFTNYDRHLQEVVKGTYGDVTVGYSVISDALSVSMDVVLVNGDGEDPADVYGTVRASQVLGGSAGAAPMTLFERSSKQSLQVRPQQSIPLLRRVLAASIYSPLTITVDLWDYDTSSADDPIGQGSVDFVVKPGMQTNNVLGKYGQVRVSLTCQ